MKRERDIDAGVGCRVLRPVIGVLMSKAVTGLKGLLEIRPMSWGIRQVPNRGAPEKEKKKRERGLDSGVGRRLER